MGEAMKLALPSVRAGARLCRQHDSRSFPVATRLLIGRAAACGLRLSDPHVSTEHATITWAGAYWEVIDHSSRNGTFIDDARILADTRVQLHAGSRIAFGDPDHAWVFEGAGAPQAMAMHVVTQEVREAQGERLVLPSKSKPEVSVYRDTAGHWQQESPSGELRVISDQEVVQTAGGAWQVQLP